MGSEMTSVIYQATVTTEGNRPAETYVGLTENSFKTRYASHKSSFRDPNKRLSTELSKHIWHLKDAKLEFNVTWKIVCNSKACKSLAVGSWVTSFSRVLPTSYVVFRAGKPIESVVYCFSNTEKMELMKTHTNSSVLFIIIYLFIFY